ncbi:MAG: archaeosortase/exosortase family protein [Chthoniobacterales bacterium]|nr:archaeosortase/exosortase family protein [Chthoniobacterales bacterium]
MDLEHSAPKVAALGAAALAALVALVCDWQLRQSFDSITYNVLAFLAVALLLDRDRNALRLQTSWSAILCAAFLLASGLAKALTLVRGDDYRHFLPLILGMGVGFIALGFAQVFRHWRALVILMALSFFDIPFSALTGPLNLNAHGATLGANILLVCGYPASSAGDVVTLPGGSVRVFGPCSAAVPLLYLLKLALLVLLLFPSAWWRKVLILLSAIIVALLGNAIRIAVMEIFAAAGDQGRFHYWHDGPGANLFSVLYVACFAGLAALSLHQWASKQILPSA